MVNLLEIIASDKAEFYRPRTGVKFGFLTTQTLGLDDANPPHYFKAHPCQNKFVNTTASSPRRQDIQGRPAYGEAPAYGHTWIWDLTKPLLVV